MPRGVPFKKLSFKPFILTTPKYDVVLTSKSTPVMEDEYVAVTRAYPELLKLCKDAGGLALAGIQVGCPKTFFITTISSCPILINPRVVKCPFGFQEVQAEGCLSDPGVFVRHKRPREVHLEFINHQHQKVTQAFIGLYATMVCHELDHLDGILPTRSLIQK